MQFTAIGVCEYPSRHLSTLLHLNLIFLILPDICLHFQNSAHFARQAFSQKPIYPCLEQIAKSETFPVYCPLRSNIWMIHGSRAEEDAESHIHDLLVVCGGDCGPCGGGHTRDRTPR